MSPIPNRSSERVSLLIIDDERPDRELTHLHLAKEGYRIRGATNGEDALRMIAEEQPDIILLDVLLPGRDGYQLAADIKSDPANSNTPIVLVTALNDREARLRGLQSGADDFLTKPIDGAELRARVRNLLRLKAAYEELSHRNAEITAALAQARLAKEDADRANVAKTHFLRVMSHEMRTPLNAIAGYAEILELGVRGTLTGDQATDLAKIKRAASYLSRLIGDVLTSERVEPVPTLTLVPVTVGMVLAEVEELCAMQARTAGLTLVVARPHDDARVLADAERLKQILLNLMTNAVKFTPRGGRVELSAEAWSSSVAIRVRDTGIGISAEKLASVFDPFVQIDRHLTPAANRGVGLGLSISRELARAMGGELTLDSTEGVGSTFTLTLAAPPAPSDGARMMAHAGNEPHPGDTFRDHHT